MENNLYCMGKDQRLKADNQRVEMENNLYCMGKDQRLTADNQRE